MEEKFKPQIRAALEYYDQINAIVHSSLFP
jgi:hypothetical protein